MNIAMLVETLSCGNGVSRTVLSLTRVLAGRGHEVHLYSSVNRLPGGGAAYFPEGKVGLHWLPSLRGSWRTWSLPLGAMLPLLALPLAARAAPRALAYGRRHDVVVSHALTVAQDVIDMHNDPQDVELAKLERIPFTIDPPRLRTGRRALRSAIERLRFSPGRHRQVVTHSRRSADEVRASFDLPADAVRVIPHGVDAAYYAPELAGDQRAEARRRYALSRADVVFLYIGDSWKGLEFAIRALARLPSRVPAVLLAAGPFPKVPFVRFAREQGVRFIGADACPDGRGLYAAADALLNPTPLDTFGLCALEALAMRLPVVTTRHAGVSELLHDGRDAFLVSEAFAVDEIAAACERLLDAGTRERMADNARRNAASHTWERAAASHLDLYEESLRRRLAGAQDAA